jgi:hypothetical protein
VRSGLLVLAIACASAQAQQPVVNSPRADSVSVTIYRDDLALITETRTVELPAGPVTVELSDVVDTLLPQTAVMTGAERPLAESNFTFDPLSPASLIERSIGKTVMLIRTDRATGKVTRTPATIVSAGEGVVLQLAGGLEALRCSGIPEGLEFAQVPGELTAKPQLSVQLGAGTAGRRTLKISYLATGMSWSSDYLAHLNDRSDRMALTGWVTLNNLTGTSFKQAQVQVVAGRLNLIDAGDGGSQDALPEGPSEEQIDAEVQLLTRCFPDRQILPPLDPGRRSRVYYDSATAVGYGDDALESIMVTGTRVISREALGDYQLYRLPWPTDLDARQTKQAAFLNEPNVRVERFYGFRLDDVDSEPGEDEIRLELVLRWENEKRAGLGEPLPRGTVRVFEDHAGADTFAGEAEITDKPVGVPVEIRIARAMDLSLESQIDVGGVEEIRNGERVEVTVEHRVVNGKAAPVEVEIRHGASSGSIARVRDATLRTRRKFGDFMWRFTVPPDGAEVLRYQLRSTRYYETGDYDDED